MLAPTALPAPAAQGDHAQATPASGGRVLHVRNLPLDATQQELIALCTPFGRVTQVLLMNTKPQAFVEFEAADSAARLLSHVAQSPAHVRGKTIYFQYSNRDTVGSHGALQAESPKPILLVTISNMLYHVTVELLYTVFCAYGPVAKIVIFTKNGAFQALVQFIDPSSAANAKTALDGQNLYVGACSMRVQYSQLPDLTVKYNNDRSRNFLDPSLPTGGTSASAYPPASYAAYPAYTHAGAHTHAGSAGGHMHAAAPAAAANGRGQYPAATQFANGASHYGNGAQYAGGAAAYNGAATYSNNTPLGRPQY